MSETVAVPPRVREGSPSAVASMNDWRAEWLRACSDPDAFWLGVTRDRIAWQTPPTEGRRGDFTSVRERPLTWFADGVLNVTESCIDRHAAATPAKIALLWQGDEPDDVRRVTYRELLEVTERFAGGLRALGVGKGDRVIIYMGMVPEAAVAMLACARLGAIHSVVFGGFSAEALRDRVRDCAARVVITQDEGLRGGRRVPLKATVDTALMDGEGVENVVVYRRTGDAPAASARDMDWDAVCALGEPLRRAVPCAAEDPLFILYTSGSTGRPKGVVHTCGGYITYTAWTHALVFDLRDDDVFGCVADVGWITGHSYIVYGPLANGATSVMFESTPMHPDPGRYWEMIDRHGITILYTAPTAIRALAARGDHHVTRHSRASLRVLGTVGEPINADAWRWYHGVVGAGRCTVVDTWWQTETGGICISAIAPATPPKPGSATLPLPGIVPVLLGTDDRVIRGPGEGRLFLAQPWPGQARTVWGDHARFVATYFDEAPDLYFTGDGCRRDGDGYHWITGRVDDVLNVAGHRMGTAEFESALVASGEVAEAAVVGFPHEIRGQGVHAFVVLPADTLDVDRSALDAACRSALDAACRSALDAACRSAIGAHARLDRVTAIPALPKTRSGKVMRRILRSIARGAPDDLGDVSTLSDPSVVEAIKAAAR